MNTGLSAATETARPAITTVAAPKIQPEILLTLRPLMNTAFFVAEVWPSGLRVQDGCLHTPFLLARWLPMLYTPKPWFLKVPAGFLSVICPTDRTAITGELGQKTQDPSFFRLVQQRARERVPTLLPSAESRPWAARPGYFWWQVLQLPFDANAVPPAKWQPPQDCFLASAGLCNPAL